MALLLGRALDVPVSCLHAPVGGSPYLVADVTKLRALGWAPAVGLADGLGRTIAAGVDVARRRP